MTRTVEEIAKALAAPFDETEVKFKPQTVSGNRALAVPYVDARVVQDRLDEVLGIHNWQDSYDILPDGAVVCRLKVRFSDEWITKEDVGSQSEQPDDGDRRKSAFSDALKRAAVKVGIGRYLYHAKPQWVDYDPVKRQFVTKPRLPAPAALQRPAPQRQGVGNGTNQTPAPVPGQVPSKPDPLFVRMQKAEQASVEEGICHPGELLDHLMTTLGPLVHGAPLSVWPENMLPKVGEEVRAFRELRRHARDVAMQMEAAARS